MKSKEIIVILLVLCGCDVPTLSKRERFEPDLVVLGKEVKEIYRKEATRDKEGLLRHWEPCRKDYRGDEQDLYVARVRVHERLYAPRPENPNCAFVVHNGYGSKGRFVDAHCKLIRAGEPKTEMLGFVALYPSMRNVCLYQYEIIMYRPLIAVPMEDME